MQSTRKLTPMVVALTACFALFSSVRAEEQSMHDGDHAMHEGHAMNHEGHAMNHQDHSMHLKAMQSREFTVSSENYSIPDVTLLNAVGAEQSLRELLSEDKPVALNFIFTTCTTICPVMTATFAQMQRELEEDEIEGLRVISISIDPEYDRPDVLSAYAKRFHAGESWIFLTGRTEDVDNVMRAFDVYEGSKMNHQPVTLLRKTRDQPWLRVDGLASGKGLASLVEQHLFD